MRGGIVPLHPASDGSRDQLLFEHLDATASAADVAVLRYDRRPPVNGDDVPLEVQAADALTAVRVLREHVGDGPIGLWGWSQGAWAAPLAATMSPDVAFLVLLAATGVSPAEQMRYGTAEQLRRNGYDDFDELDQLRRAYEGARRGSLGHAEAQAIIDRYADRPWFDLAYVPRTLDDSTWDDMDFDPAPMIAKVTCPVLLFYGEEDEWTPIDPSIAAWDRSPANVTVVRLPGTMHAPTTADGAISADYTRTLAELLRDLP